MPLSPHLKEHEPWSDARVIERVLTGDAQMFELIMRRHNERIYRAVRSILKDEAEAEDAMQAAYLHAFAHLREFEGRAAFATWLTRIAIHEALGRRRRGLRSASDQDEPEVAATTRSPEEGATDMETRKLLANASMRCRSTSASSSSSARCRSCPSRRPRNAWTSSPPR